VDSGSKSEKSELLRSLGGHIGALRRGEDTGASEGRDLAFLEDVLRHEHRRLRMFLEGTDPLANDRVRSLGAISTVTRRMPADETRLPAGPDNPDPGHQVVRRAALILLHPSRLQRLAVDPSDVDAMSVSFTAMTTDQPITTIEQLIEARERFDTDLRAAVTKAETWAALADVATDLDEDSAEFEEAREIAYDERFHCEVCLVRGILENFWPPIQQYLDVVESAAGHGDPKWNQLI